MLVKTLRAHSIWAALLAFALNIGIFLTIDTLKPPPMVDSLGNNAASIPAPAGILEAVNQLPVEALVAGVLCLIVAGLGWWRAVGFRKPLPGSLKFFVFPVIFLLGFYGTLTFYSVSQGAVDVFTWGVLSVSAAYVANFLLVGFAEELMFRGILFEAFRTKLTPLLTVLGTALIFASVHLINLVHGASLQGTTDQIINAFAIGVMLGALRLRVASIYPLMLFHALWDIVTADFEITQTTGATATTPAVTDAVGAGSTLSPIFILQVLVPLLYGLFVYWRYSKSVKAGKIPDRPALLDEQTTLNPAV